jgi:translocation and assembly module TamB
LSLLAAIFFTAIALAQERGEESNSAITSLFENQLSSPNRQIRFSGIRGVLTSEASIELITIGDRDGVWLRIEDVEIEWSRLALLRGRLQINNLRAERIEVSRRPISDTGLPTPEARRFALPELPVSVNIEAFNIASTRFGEDVFGLASEVTISGAVTLQDGSLDSSLEIDRLDGPGGQLILDASYVQDTEQLDIELELREPENGVVANLIKIEERPPVDLTLNGSGPIDNVDLELTFDAGGQRVLTGIAQLRGGGDDLSFSADVSGPIASVIAPTYRPFFGAETSLATEGRFLEGGGISIERFELGSAQLSISASGETGNHFLQKLSLRGRILDNDGGAVVLPVSGGLTSIQDARFAIEFGTDANGRWSAELSAAGYSAPDLKIGQIVFTGGGDAENLNDPAGRSITFSGTGSVTDIASENADLMQAIGDKVDLELAGDWQSGEPLRLTNFSAKARELLLSLKGSIADYTFSGDTSLETSDLAPLSGLLGQDIEGSANISASGEVLPLSGGFDLNLNGSVGDLRLENESLDGLLRGTTTVSGGFARNETGFNTREFHVENSQVQFRADGSFATGSADFEFEVNVNDLASVSDKTSGELTATGFARGSGGQIGLSAEVLIPTGTLLEKSLSDASLSFSGSRSGGDITGQIVGGARFDETPVVLRSDLTLRRSGARELENLRFDAQGAAISGSLSQTESGLFDGDLNIEATDIATLAALFLQEATGAIDATVQLRATGDRQDAALDANFDKISIRTLQIDNGQADFDMTDLFGSPTANGNIRAAHVEAGGIKLTSLEAIANRRDDETTVEANVDFETGATAQLRGTLSPLSGGLAFDFEELALVQGEMTAHLTEPARLAVNEETIGIEALQMEVGTGKLSISGTLGEDLDLEIQIDELPIDIVNSIKPELGLEGAINGSAAINGTRDKPRVNFDVSAEGVTAAMVQDANVQAISIKASGVTAEEGITLTAEASNGQGLKATARGRIPLTAGDFDLRVDGEAPLSLAEPFIDDRGAQTTGTVQFNLTISGPRDDPVFDGGFSIRDAQFVDPQTNIRLRKISVDGALSPSAVQITQAQAELADGGTVSASGQISLESHYPVALDVTLDGARYRKEDLLSAILNGRLNVSGSLLRDPLISGSIDIDRAEIDVPDNFGGGAVSVSVQHRYSPPAVTETLARARLKDAVPIPTARPSVVQLDIGVTAERRIFVRGRGLDAELGGSIRITGPITDIRPIGGFTLIRGRLSILGERVVFEEGSVQLRGSLDPVLRFVARIVRSDLTIVVTVAGRTSSPEIILSSQPELPEDEILANLIFNRGLNELSALQVARLAAAAAELAGSGSTLTGKLREATGLDDIDVYTTEEGETAVRAGRYIKENIYLGVEAGSSGTTAGTINLDLTDNLKAKGSLSSDGSSGIGLFFEKDY